MKTAIALPMEAPEKAGKNSAENDPKWESSTPDEPENQRIIGVSFGDPNTRKCECLNLQPQRVPNAERRSREFLTPAEVDRLIKAASGRRMAQRPVLA